MRVTCVNQNVIEIARVIFTHSARALPCPSHPFTCPTATVATTTTRDVGRSVFVSSRWVRTPPRRPSFLVSE